MTYEELVLIAREILGVVDYDIYKDALVAEEEGDYTLFDEITEILYHNFGDMVEEKGEDE